ncbi:MAG TPA: histidine kinase [Candidatus Saccharimonadales bacterium]|nr:histidine kinase [Candidatus Saccharimonadales bacterium]
MDKQERRSKALRALANLIWKQPLYALPFALFFGTVYEHGWPGYLLALQVSVALAYPIGLGVWTARYLAVPRLKLPGYDAGAGTVWRESAVYAALAVLGAYVGAVFTQLWLMPGFLGGPRQVFITGGFTLIFCALFTALSYAQNFYRRWLDRVRAVEGMRAELAQAELRTLRAQVNPHFLFNTLNSIAALIPANPTVAEEITTRLAEVFRYALRASDREHATLGEELAFVRAYLDIEKVRLGERLRVEEDVRPGLESLPVPALLLQPLVENAVRHGVSPRVEGGVVRLAARREDARLVIEVADDGPGMAATPARGGTGFGLRSVQDRLAALGPPHALHIESNPGRGTRVRVTLPAEPQVPIPSTRPSEAKECCDEP